MVWESEPLERYRCYSGAGTMLAEIIEEESGNLRWIVIADDGLVGRAATLEAAKRMASDALKRRGLKAVPA